MFYDFDKYSRNYDFGMLIGLEIKANFNNQLVLNELDKVVEQLDKMENFPKFK